MIMTKTTEKKKECTEYFSSKSSSSSGAISANICEVENFLYVYHEK